MTKIPQKKQTDKNTTMKLKKVHHVFSASAVVPLLGTPFVILY
jgi:hypothetical protein